MLLDLDDDRRAFRDSVRTWVDKNFPPEKSLEIEKQEYRASGVNCHQEANIVKVVTSEYAVAAAERGIQILGGMGISQETHAQRFWRDLRQFRIAPISNEMVRNNLAESFGLPRSY